MGVGASAGLNLADLDRPNRIGDVKDADAAEARVAGLGAHALTTAIDAAIGGFHRHDQQVVNDGDVTLAAGTDHRRDQLGLVTAEAIQVEAMVGADRHQVALEGHVGIGKRQERAAHGESGLFGTVTLFVIVGGRQGQGRTRRIGRVVETLRLGQAGDQDHVGDGLLGIEEAAGQGRARVGLQRAQGDVHAADFGLLLIGDVSDELEQRRLIGRAGPRQQVLDHGHGPGMVADHQVKEQAVEIRAGGGGQGRHLLGAGHAGHVRMVHGRAVAGVGTMSGMVAAKHWNRLAALAQPGAHEGDFIVLGGADAVTHRHDVRVVGPGGDQGRHLDRLLMVDHHALHEGDVVVRIAVVRDAGGGLGLQHAAGLAGGTGLDDRRCGLGLGGSGRDQGCDRAAQEKTNRPNRHAKAPVWKCDVSA